MTGTFARVADFALNRSADQMPDSAKEAAALMMLDTMGILIASGPMEAGVIARDTAALLYGSSDPDYSARMMFDGRPVSMAGAAYAAATQTDNLDGHDGYNPTKGHIGVVVLPALIAMAAHRPDLTGPEALATVITGYEIAGRAGLSLHASVSDYHTSGAWNALGVVAMAARLRGHSQDQMRQAMGIAEYHGPRSQMMREIANPTMLHDGSGWGALVGVFSRYSGRTWLYRCPRHHDRGRNRRASLGRSRPVLAGRASIRETLPNLPLGPCRNRRCPGGNAGQ